MPDAAFVPFTLAEFQSGEPLSAYARALPGAQPDFALLLQESVVPAAAVDRLRAAGARYAAVITEPWCFDSLHAIPLLLRMQDALPELEIRTWKRADHPELAMRVAGEHPGGKLPSVPHVAFYDAAFGELGHFCERPASISAWLDEESRDFRTRLRMQERDRVRSETLEGLLAAAEERPAPRRPTEGRPLTVYEEWTAREPGLQEQLEEVLRRHLPSLQTVPGVRSVDFAEVDGRPGRYLAIFRYDHEGIRPTFLASEPVRALRAEVDPLWARVSESTWSYGL